MNGTRPTRSSSAGSAYFNLRKLARGSGRPTDELHQLYALEGFLARLAQSPYADQLILKGGVLLAAYNARRPTRDIDFHARRLPGDGDTVLELVRRVARLPADDGLTFDVDGAIAETIRDEEPYAGVRVTMTAQLATARLRFHVDINVGDPVHPEPQSILLPQLLGGSIQLLGYPLPMVLAEKIVTAVQRGSANTRWRDYADIYLLTNRHEVDTDQLLAAIMTVANHRHAVLIPLRQILDDYALRAQQRWAAWRRKQRLDDRLPESFGDLLDFVITFTDPVLTTTTITQRKKTEPTAEQLTADCTAPTPPASGEHPRAG